MRQRLSAARFPRVVPAKRLAQSRRSLARPIAVPQLHRVAITLARVINIPIELTRSRDRYIFTVLLATPRYLIFQISI